MDKKGIIRFTPEEGGEPDTFYIIDQVTFAGTDYLMVTDVDPQSEEEADEEDGIALILKNMTPWKKENESVYEIVEDDTELSAVSTLFKDALDEFGIELEE